MLQPNCRPISGEQLVVEVKGIYAGLVIVEAKYIDVVNKLGSQASTGNPLDLRSAQWQALIALHRTLLHEHHDFLLASQHPSSSPALRRLASKYFMPRRLWRHGIYSFLELLRSQLPASLDYMLAFIYLTYSMMSLLYETVPAFEITWIEILIFQSFYQIPTTSRLYYYLAILVRPNALQQLFYFSKSLCVTVLYDSARESILNYSE
ncbi:hypothetical protein BGZ60DRAFT_469014 [Tricladium varicosporioides]|nr:hypothetical protein BGZ60DRAFT_469014 [Hymenoscyphus varicosporioides]